MDNQRGAPQHNPPIQGQGQSRGHDNPGHHNQGYQNHGYSSPNNQSERPPAQNPHLNHGHANRGPYQQGYENRGHPPHSHQRTNDQPNQAQRSHDQRGQPVNHGNSSSQNNQNHERSTPDPYSHNRASNAEQNRPQQPQGDARNGTYNERRPPDAGQADRHRTPSASRPGAPPTPNTSQPVRHDNRGPPPQSTRGHMSSSEAPQNQSERPNENRPSRPPPPSNGGNYPGSGNNQSRNMADNRSTQPYNKSQYPSSPDGLNKPGYAGPMSHTQRQGQHQEPGRPQHSTPNHGPGQQPPHHPPNTGTNQETSKQTPYPHGSQSGQYQEKSKQTPYPSNGQSGQNRDRHKQAPYPHGQYENKSKQAPYPSKGQPRQSQDRTEQSHYTSKDGHTQDGQGKRTAPGVPPQQQQPRHGSTDPSGDRSARDNRSAQSGARDKPGSQYDLRQANRGPTGKAVSQHEPHHQQQTRAGHNQPSHGDRKNQQDPRNTQSGPQAPPRNSSKGVVQQYDHKDKHGYSNQAYKSDEGFKHHEDGKRQPGYGHKEPTAPPLGQMPSAPQYQSTSALHAPYPSQFDPNDPLANPYAAAQGSAAQKQYGSMSALHSQAPAGRPQPHAQQKSPGAQATPGSVNSTTTALPSYSNAQNMRQGRSMHELNAASLSAHPQGDDRQSGQGQDQSQGHHKGQQDGNDRRRYEKRNSAMPSQSQAPRATKRGRILSQQEQPQQRSPPQGQESDGSTNPGQFDSRPPMRAQSVTDIHLSVSPGPAPTTNLHRPASVPNISGTVALQENQAAPVTLNQNGVQNGRATGIWRAPSALDLALHSGGSSLQRSKSLTSLVVANPRLARTASQVMLYEMQVEQGKLPNDHFQTMTLAIISSAIILPFTGFPLLYFTWRNKAKWTDVDNILNAMTTNTRLFWASIASIVLGVILWVLLIIFLSILVG